MHAFLLIGTGDLKETTDNLAKKLKTRVMEFPLAKIEDVRNLNDLIRLSFDEPTLIVSNNINDATEEALNAFLKNLEEPQDNIYFALIAPSAKKVLPTIVSRCQVIWVMGEGQKTEDEKEVQKFLNMPVGEKLAYTDKIRHRDIALKLAENTVIYLHSQLHKNELKYDVVARNLEIALKTYSRLKGNGNVNLQMVDFSINYLNG